MSRDRTNEKLKAATLAQCRRELGTDSHFFGLGYRSIWETELRADAEKKVRKIEVLVAQLESAQLADWVAGGGTADGVHRHDEDDAPPDYMSEIDTPAYVVARILREAVERAKAAMASGSRLEEYVAQFDKSDHDVTWHGAVMHVKGLSDRDVALRALLQGYWPSPRKGQKPLQLEPKDVIETVRKAVHACRQGK